MQRPPSEKFVLLFEALKRTLIAADGLHSRLRIELVPVSAAIDCNQDPASSAICPFVSAVALIDFAHRYKELFEALPVISKRSPALIDLRSATRAVESARNYLQHMRGDLNSHSAIDYPVLGGLSWIRNDKCYTLMFAQASVCSSPSIYYDMAGQKWVTSLQYVVKEQIVDFDLLFRVMHASFSWLRSSFEFNPASFGELSWGPSMGCSISRPSLIRK